MEKEELYARVETTESFSIKLEQILPWQDGQYAEVFLGIRDYDEISAKMSEEVKNSLLYHLGTHIQKHLKGQEMVCHVKKDEFLLLLDNHVEAAWEKIGHIMIMFEAMIGDKYPMYRSTCTAAFIIWSPEDTARRKFSASARL